MHLEGDHVANCWGDKLLEGDAAGYGLLESIVTGESELGLSADSVRKGPLA